MNFLLENKYMQNVKWCNDKDTFDSNDEWRQVYLREPKIEEVILRFCLYEHVSY